MNTLSGISSEEFRNIKYILTDIDDTLTRKGRILPETYTALWNLKEAGYYSIPITGRPAGWCDCIARQWPVAGIIGENGAFAFYMDDGKLNRMYHPSAAPENARNKLRELGNIILEKVPGSRIAKDQFCRMFDLAVDFREEPPFLGLQEAEEIRDICEDFGATAKISSIHVNAWFGTYNKLDMTLMFLENRFGLSRNDAQNTCCFCGDSPNDEPMFEFFPISCGVANISPFLSSLASKPAFVTEKTDGEGFAEFIRALIE